MQPSEITGLHYHLMPSTNPSPYSTYNFSMNTTHQDNNNNTPAFQFNRYPIPHNFQISPHQLQEFSLQSSCLSNNSTSDEADEQQISLINERKQRRMISNRESARRSRMRKQKHLDELWSQVVWLRNENHQLIDKLNHVTECHDQVVQENVQLKEQASELRQMLSDMQLNSNNNNSPFASLRDLDEIPCNSAYLRAAESSNQSITYSSDLLG